MADEPPTGPSGPPEPGVLEEIPAAVAETDGLKEHQIRERAYLIWINEGRPHGRELDHWLRAKWEFEHEPNA